MTKPIVQASATLLAVLVLAGPVSRSWAQPADTNRLRFSVSGQEVEGYRLIISTSNTTYAAGQLVPLAISLQNLSTNVGRISVTTGYRFFSFEVMAPDGLPAPITEFGTNALYPIVYTRLSSVEIPVGESRIANAALNLLFNLTRPGEYTVTVSRQVPKRRGPYKEMWVRAGPLKIVITEPQKGP